MHWTGMRPSQMGRLTRDDFRLGDAIPFVAVPRGKGGRLAAVPLVDDAVQAARDFIARDAFGRWSCPSANKALATAARKANRDPFTVYQIRHSFSAALRRTGADVADIQDLYGHTDPEITQIYAPPTLAKHLSAIERLRDDAEPLPPQLSGARRPVRLAEKAENMISQLYTTICGSNSVVECQLPKLKVAGSTPVSRSILFNHLGDSDGVSTPDCQPVLPAKSSSSTASAAC